MAKNRRTIRWTEAVDRPLLDGKFTCPRSVIGVVRDPMKEAVLPSGFYKIQNIALVFGLIMGVAVLLGCYRPPMTGSDDPVTTERLTGSRLVDMRQDLSWTFDDTTVVIENRDQPLPQDLVQELLGDRTAPIRVEADWEYDEKSGVLRLSDATADGDKIAKDLAIPIKPAGQVRVNLGSRQYNLFRVKTNDP